MTEKSESVFENSSYQTASKGVSTLGHRVSISIRSEIVSGSVSLREPRLWTTTHACFGGQITLEWELEPTENHEKKHERSETISVLEDVR